MHWWLPTTSNRGNGARDQQRGRTGGHRLRGCVSDFDDQHHADPAAADRWTSDRRGHREWAVWAGGLSRRIDCIVCFHQAARDRAGVGTGAYRPGDVESDGLGCSRAHRALLAPTRAGATRCIASVSTSGEVIRAKTLNFPETCAGDQQSQPGILRRKHLMYYRGLGTLRSQPVLGGECPASAPLPYSRPNALIHDG